MKRIERLSTLIIAALLIVFAAFLIGCSSGNNANNMQNEQSAFENVSDVPAPAEPEPVNEVDARIASMTLSDKVAALFIVCPEALQPSEGTVTEVSDELKATLDTYPVSGICWMQVNLQNAQQTSGMLASVSETYAQQNNGLLLFQAVDEEGGTVERIAGNPGFDVPAGADIHDIGVSGDANAAYSVGHNIAGYLKPLGFNLDFGIVADMTDDPNDAMYLRSFGSDAALSSAMVAAETHGMLDGGVLPCIKHCPGLGGAAGGDSHEGQVTSTASEEELVSYNLATFKSAIEAGAPMIMTGHLTCLNIDPDRPATLSHKIVTEIMRGHLGYDGIIVTDSIQMKAVSDVYGEAEASVLALEAGCDIVLMPTDLSAAHQGVMDAIASGRLSEQRIDDSLRRILTVKLAYLQQ